MESRQISSVDQYLKLVSEDFTAAKWVEAPASLWLSILMELPNMKEDVLLNKRLPEQILNILSMDEDSRVRSLVAMKRQLSNEIFQRLACDTCEGVRMRIALNPKTPVEILERMQGDSWDNIGDTVRKRLAERGKFT